ncbi:hypothetical protein GFB82_21245 [Acinetobacter baumannii]|nr:hypothetical protein [Acinetobacter baumannii]MCG6572870.1 hypothetical protein [Acinetobacter baumannii]
MPPTRWGDGEGTSPANAGLHCADGGGLRAQKVGATADDVPGGSGT